MNNPVLSVCLITYNQALYIRQAVESILLQHSTFEWELIIADDCSRDGTADIVREYSVKYPDRIRLILQDRNVGAARNWSDLMRSAQGKYIAYLEGDDYWTDPGKLEKEVAFLENNADYSLVCTDYDILAHSSGELTGNFLGKKYGLKKEHDIVLADYIFSRRAIRSLTVVFRRDMLEAYFNEIGTEVTHNPSAGDLPLWLFILSRSRARYMPCSTATYRILPGTGSRPVDPLRKKTFQDGVCDILEYFIDRNKLPHSFKNKLGIQRTLNQMEYSLSAGNKRANLKSFLALLSKGVVSRRAFNIVIKSIFRAPKGVAE